MELLAWVAEFLGEFFPPWAIIDPTNTGVRCRSIPMPVKFKKWADGKRFLWMLLIPPHGQIIREVGQGWVFSIPFIDEVWDLPTQYASDDLANIECETADGEVYDISPVIEWKVFNPVKAATEVMDYEDSLANRVRSIIVAWVSKQHGRISVQRLVRRV